MAKARILQSSQSYRFRSCFDIPFEPEEINSYGVPADLAELLRVLVAHLEA